MKPSLAVLLLVSLAGNAVLAVLALREKPAPTAAAARSPVVAAAPAITATTPPPGPGHEVAPINWQTLKPGPNLHDLVANLRAAGFPPSVIRAVANQVVSERLNTGALDHLPFWKQNGSNPEYLAAQQQLSIERREMLAELLGPDARASATMDPSSRQRRFGSLSDEKVDQLESITRDFSDMRTKLFAERKPGDTQNMMGVQAAMEQEYQKELATVLNPAELEQFEMRSSQSASRLMSNVKGIEVTEAEYTDLFRAQKAYDSVDPLRAGVVTPDAMALRNTAQEMLNEQARAVLSDDRFYEYLKGSDQNYARTAQFTASYPEITLAMTYELTQIERDYQSASMSMARTAASGGQPSPERMAQLTAARKDYQEKINTLLGAETAKAYAQRNRTGVMTGPAIRIGP